jgi:general nucleoside transport system permease protein
MLGFSPATSSVVAIIAALLAGALLILSTGMDPLRSYGSLAAQAMTGFGVTETLVKMAPLLMVATGLLLSFRGGLFNVGADGQFLVGALVVGALGPLLLPKLSHAVILGWMFLGAAGFAGGALWAVVPALLRIRYGLNEIITTIMMNYVALLFTGWLVKGPLRDPTVVPPQTPEIPTAFRLPALVGRVHVGLIVALLAAVAVHYVIGYTKLGFKITVLGSNLRAAVHAGFPIGRLWLLVFLLGAGFAGLAGANDVLGVKGLFQAEWNPEYGLTGVALVLLSRLNSLAIIPLAYFFSFLLFGGELMSVESGIPVFFIDVLSGLMLIFFAASVVLERRRTA